MNIHQATQPAFQKQPPLFYAGDELHRIKQENSRTADGNFFLPLRAIGPGSSARAHANQKRTAQPQ